MNTDCYFAKGKTHRICEDYALAPNDYVAVVTDGCSSSGNTDWGARFIARAAALQWDATGEPVGSRIAFRADYMRLGAGLHQTSLDATLLMAYWTADAVEVRAWGDGVIYARRRDGSSEFYLIEYLFNAPAYLSYLLDEERLNTFLSNTRAEREVHRYTAQWTNDEFTMMSETTRRSDFPYDGDHFEFPADDYDVVAVLSDGVQSFQMKEGRALQNVPVPDVLDRMLDIKGTKGEFITRPARWMLDKFCPKNGWHHNDDVAVAAIHVGDRDG